MPDDDGNAIRRELAAALSALSIQQGANGQPAVALATATEAVTILRELARDENADGRPDFVGAVKATVPSQRVGETGRTDGTLQALFLSGYGRVIGLGIARTVVRRRGWPGMGSALASSSVAASLPLVAELVLLAANSRQALHTLDAISWVAALSGVTTALLVAVWGSWSMLHRAGPAIDEMLALSVGRSALLRWFDATLRRGRQILVATLATAGGCALLYFAQPAIENRLEIGPMSYASVGWTAFLVGNAAYWLVAVSRLSRRILRFRDLSFIWHSPASTPGIVQLSRGHTFGTAVILLLAVGVELLALRIATYGQSPVLETVSIVLPIVAALAALIFGALPHWWLYLAVRDARQQVLRRLAPLSAQPPTTAREIAEAQGRVGLYSMVESSPGLPFSTGTMVQYAAAVVSTLVGTLLVILFGVG
jgi:hypothetical protein